MNFLWFAGVDIFSPYMLIIECSAILVLSYFFNVIAQKTSIPSVLLLILTGILLKVAVDQSGREMADLMPALEILGIIGLIMIVLEAALDLEISKDKLPVIGKSLAVALICLIGTSMLMGLVLQQFFDATYVDAMIYATPLAIMSSAIIIPSAAGLVPIKREFMIYESTFSDILGIMMFYFLLTLREEGGSGAIMGFGVSFILTIIVAVVATFLIIFIFKDLKSHNRLFLLIAVLLILYAMGKLLHLSPLLIILVFGIALANHKSVFKVFRNRWSTPDGGEDPIDKIEKEFHLITMETAFVVRTFFFVVFGLTIALGSLLDFNVFLVSLLFLLSIYLIRFGSLKLFLPKISPELYIAPRGLITILLFFAIPAEIGIEGFSSGILLYVILISSIIMSVALVRDKSTSAEVSKKESI